MRTIFSFMIIVFFTCSVFKSESQIKHRVMMEIKTSTTNNEWGEIGIPQINSIVNENPDDILVVEYHYNDVFRSDESAFFHAIVEPGPNIEAAIDRLDWIFYDSALGRNTVEFWIEPEDWDSLSQEALNFADPVEVSLSCSIFVQSRELIANINAKFYDTLSGDYRFNVMITEDSLVHSQEGISGDFVHNNVLRKNLGWIWGTENSLPTEILPGDSLSYTYTVTLDSNWNIDNLNFIGVVQQGETYLPHQMQILNCVRASVVTVIVNNYNPLETENGTQGESQNGNNPFCLSVAPNPVKNLTEIASVLQNSEYINIGIYDIYGRLVENIFSGTLHKGINKLSYYPKNLSNGTYFIKLYSSDKCSTAKIQILE